MLEKASSTTLCPGGSKSGNAAEPHRASLPVLPPVALGTFWTGDGAGTIRNWNWNSGRLLARCSRSRASTPCLTTSTIAASPQVVSNTVFSSRTVEWELARHGLTKHLSFVMGSSDYGVRKPHADLFLTAVRKLGLSPSEVWYVGNSLEADIAGASEAGLVPVWYTRRVRDPSHFNGLSFEHWDAFAGLLKAA